MRLTPAPRPRSARRSWFRGAFRLPTTMLPLLLVLLLALPAGVRADGDLLPPDQMCVQAIFTAAGYIRFVDPDANATATTTSALQARHHGSHHRDEDDASGDGDVEAAKKKKMRVADYCVNRLKVDSIYAAAKVHCCGVPAHEAGSCGEGGFEGIVEHLHAHCRKWGGGPEMLAPPAFVVDGSVDEIRARLRSVEYGEVPKGTLLEEAVLISDGYYLRTYETILSWRYSYYYHKHNGTSQYEFWAVVLCTAAVVHFFRHSLRNGQSLVLRVFRSLCSLSLFQSSVKWVERWIPASLAYERVPGVAVTNEKDSRSCFRFKFSPVAETLTIWLYWVFSIVMNTYRFRFFFGGNLYFPEHERQIMRYVADRTGILSYANLPILWLFSGRNNIFMWATGWKFPTFIRFHLHVAWIATIEAIIHSVLYTILTVSDSIFWTWVKVSWFFLGIVATFVMTFLIAVSTPIWLREKYYELFIDSHIVSSIITLVGLYYHTSVFDHEYDWYILVPVFFWCLDRLLRTIRIASFNIGISGRRVQLTKTTARYDEKSNIITLEMIPGPKINAPKPGEYYFLYEPFSLRGYENHPMTLGTWRTGASDNEEEGIYPLTRTSSAATTRRPSNAPSEQPLLSSRSTTNLLPTIADEDDEDIEDATVPLKHRSSSGSADAKNSSRARLIFWIRPYDGWTRRLRDKCLQSKRAGHACRPFILLEGPYGHSHRLHDAYDAAVLVAGGSGISAAVPYLQAHSSRRRAEALKREQEGRGGGRSKSAPAAVDEDEEAADTEALVGGDKDVGGGASGASMQLVWAAREEAFIRDVAGAELGAGIARGDFAAAFYCTGLSAAASPSSSSPPSSSSSPAAAAASGPSPGPDSSAPALGDAGYAGSGGGGSSSGGGGGGGGLIDIQPGRPDIRAIIMETAQLASAKVSAATGSTRSASLARRPRIAVLLCGPPGMARGVEAAARAAAERYDCWVDYFDEVFSW